MQNQQRSQYLDPKDLSLFQFLEHNHIQGDQEFLSAIDGIVLNLQLKDHNLLNEAKHMATLNHGHLIKQNGHGLPIVDYLGCDLKTRARRHQQYLPSPLEHLDALSLPVAQHPLPIHELRLQYDVRLKGSS
ncbi:Uncharacterised protein [Acinetobacter baumannii]|nr:Uncharacterised protein [Acinetobacter baumannii]